MLPVWIHFQVEGPNGLAVEIHGPLLDQASRRAARGRNSARHREVDDAERLFRQAPQALASELLEMLRRLAAAELRLEIVAGAEGRLGAVVHRDNALGQALL